MSGWARPSCVRLLAMLAGLHALACSDEGADRLGQSSANILGGAPAPDDTSVVGVVNFAGGQCSGSLIAPQLVLTARHCVADTAGEDLKVLCGETPFEAPDSPGAIFVVPHPEITDAVSDYWAVSDILMPDDVADDLCGTDEVLLVLKEPLSELTPLEPRFDPPVAAGEGYSAVGYGVDEAEKGHPSGVRKRLDGLTVACLGEDCRLADVRENEWIGNGGPCHGDSGGPALDGEGRVIGVVSRGKDGCGEPVFGDVATRADWLKQQATKVALDTQSAPPSWAPCEESQTCPMEEPVEEPLTEPPKPKDDLDSTCAFSPRPTSNAAAWSLLAGALLVLRRRRRPL